MANLNQSLKVGVMHMMSSCVNTVLIDLFPVKARHCSGFLNPRPEGRGIAYSDILIQA